MGSESSWPLHGTAPERYEQYIVPAWMGAWTNILIERARIVPGDQILDIACGTGVVARRAAHLVGPRGRVIGIDADRNMLVAASNFADSENLSVTEWRLGDAANIPVETGVCDLVLCQQGLQFFSEKQRALEEMFRVLVPGGRIALSVWRSIDRCPLFAILADIIGEYIGFEPTRAFYSSCSLFDREELRGLLTGALFSEINISLEVQMARFSSLEEFLPGYISVFPFSHQIAEMSDDEQNKMFTEIKKSLLTFSDDYGLAVPMESHIITAWKYDSGK
ncbi:class I SAM-dependent methyltransferase [Desulfogranum japonicum]|uniref:class I SAM-dependent methyltransferase n=1 Tax=Desulfogranum japonicum TaxID=231447 RepID=UPI0004061090|nr:methyltransferase domain-containing protein [Desulfogranum japonicum]